MGIDRPLLKSLEKTPFFLTISICVEVGELNLCSAEKWVELTPTPANEPLNYNVKIKRKRFAKTKEKFRNFVTAHRMLDGVPVKGERSQKNMDEIYLIWSHEHGRWWMPGGRGYTTSPALAGRYDREAALRICVNAMPGTAERLGALPELPVRLADIETMLGPK